MSEILYDFTQAKAREYRIKVFSDGKPIGNIYRKDGRYFFLRNGLQGKPETSYTSLDKCKQAIEQEF